MAFIDGENLVCRFQDMIASGRQPWPQVVYHKDVYVWNPGLHLRSHWRIVRAYYYTSVTGSDEDISTLRLKIRQVSFANTAFNSPFAWLHPVVFKKSRNSRKVKVVDVQLVTDMLSQVYQDNVDVVLLFTGDGDFAAAVREVMARGKQIVVAGFSKGMNKTLMNAADRNMLLDDFYFEPRTVAPTPSIIADPDSLLSTEPW
jgi:hypothetical protein